MILRIRQTPENQDGDSERFKGPLLSGHIIIGLFNFNLAFVILQNMFDADDQVGNFTHNIRCDFCVQIDIPWSRNSRVVVKEVSRALLALISTW